ncbi:MAG TPA: PQQ-dependent sugar dehydrogenase [Thermoanaerobaculia bacterium]|nr:PQQ-dependent sugar dehydrogenase [Thermoanaerobaculia bacterium]
MKQRQIARLFPALFLALGLGAWTPAVAVPGTFITTVQIASGLPNIVDVTNAKDKSGRLFIVQQTGQIRIWNGAQILATPFLDTTAVSSSCSGGCGERGLLGLAFHPNYATNGFFFVYYTRQSDGAIQIARYHVSANPNVADSTSGLVLLTIPHPGQANHNGGNLEFGPDGYLYIGTGDGGGGGDPFENGQNINALLGKLLRIDVDSGSPYGIPPTNPFATAASGAGAHEIWSYGLRNPWRFSFDRQTGDLYIGDVGQDLYEEVDFQAAGAAGGRNYGWDCREGFHPYSDPNGDMNVNCGSVTSVDPVLEYPHNPECSITGGFVFRNLPDHDFTGSYFFSDYCSGKIWSTSQSASWVKTLRVSTNSNVTSFGEGETGRIYFTLPTSQTLQWLAPYTFADVTPTYFAWSFVEAVSGQGILPGCGGDDFCPDGLITRGEMAVFLLNAKEGSSYIPPACTTPVFADVPCSNPQAPWINEVARRGITAGCGNGNFCPTGTVTRGQMAVFLLTTLQGPGYTPPTCPPTPFGDVPASSSFCPWVKEIAARGITAGCGNGNFCPDTQVSRGQMSVFLATNFRLSVP